MGGRVNDCVNYGRQGHELRWLLGISLCHVQQTPKAPTATNRWHNIKKENQNSAHLLAEVRTQASLPRLFHICMELDAKRKIFVKVTDYLLGFPIFFNNFSNFPRACESPQCKLFDPRHCLYNKP